MRALREHPLLRRSGPVMRYVLAGATVAGVYVGLTLLFSGPGGLPIQLAIAVAYLLAVILHFLLQRAFVFQAESVFAISTRDQVARYVVIGVFQFIVSATATTFLPSPLGVSEQIVYVGTVAILSAGGFVLLRSRVFHPAADGR